MASRPCRCPGLPRGLNRRWKQYRTFKLDSACAIRLSKPRRRFIVNHMTAPAFPADAVLAPCPPPPSELIPQMVIHDGNQEVRGYYNYTRTAFPDQDHEIIALRH